MQLIFSLKRALTFNFLLVAAVPVLLFGLIIIDLVSKQQLEGVRGRNLKQATNVAGEIESFLLEVQSDLQHVNQTIASGEIIKPDKINDFLAGVVGSSRFFESIYQLDQNLHVLNLGVMPTLQLQRSDYANLDFSGHQLFHDAGKIRGTAWSDTFISLITGEPCVTLGMQMPQGFLLGNIRLNSLERILAAYSEYADVEVAVIDNHGTLIADNVSGTGRLRTSFGNHPAVLAALNGEVSSQTFVQGDKHYLESAVHVAPSNWVVLVALDMNKTQAPIRKTRNLLITIMLIAVALASVIAVLNVRRLMKPLNALGERAGMIADGNYDFRFRPSGFIEIDALANQITSMTQAIKVREESIIANEQRFRNLVNSIEGVVWEMDYPSFRFLFVSKQAESILGYPLQDWYEVPDFWEAKTHPDDFEQAKSYCRLMTEKQEEHEFEYRMITADCRIVWIRNLVTVVVEEGRPVRLVGVMIDVSSEKELLDELSRSEQNYREIFNASSDAIFVHDAATGELVDVNPSMLKMFNCTYEEAIRGGVAGLSEGVSPYSMREAFSKLQEARAKGSCKFEWHSRKKTGELFWSDVYLRSAFIGGQERILAAVRDISDRKAAEEELARYRSSLEDLVRDRSEQLELAQQELVQKERLAVLGQLTATVSHEIRNPLGTVANALYLLRESLDLDESPRLAKPLQLAERNVERCDEIINDLLDFSRQRTIDKQPLDIDAWIGELWDELSIPTDVKCARNLEVGVDVPADPERLRRVLVNVITNALQALDETSGRVKKLEVRTRVVDDRCEIIVTDNGPGMSEEVLAKIFEPMFSTKNFGVGLGVPIIKNILEGHGGGVEYQSGVGQGTRVTMWLPMTGASRTT